MTNELSVILMADRPTLLKCWQAVFGREPPPHTHVSFMRLALAWQHQLGGDLAVPAKLPGAPKAQRRKAPLPRPGSRLVREWQGRTYHVTVTMSGVEYGGRTYRSLSAVARLITGTAWSGPAFFGVGR